LHAARGIPRRYAFDLLPAVPAVSAATATAATATTAATTTAAESTATTTATRRLGTSFVHVERAAVHFRSVQLGNRILRIAFFGHFHEGKPARLPCVPVRHNIYTLDVAVLCKRRVQFVLRGLIAQISDKDVCHA
jgi:hypothetical protein